MLTPEMFASLPANQDALLKLRAIACGVMTSKWAQKTQANLALVVLLDNTLELKGETLEKSV